MTNDLDTDILERQTTSDVNFFPGFLTPSEMAEYENNHKETEFKSKEYIGPEDPNAINTDVPIINVSVEAGVGLYGGVKLPGKVTANLGVKDYFSVEIGGALYAGIGGGAYVSVNVSEIRRRFEKWWNGFEESADWGTKMKQREIACIICGLLLVLTIMDHRIGIICLGEPLILPIMEFMVADEYYSAINVPCHYMGNKLLNQECTEGAEWKGLFYYYDEPWSFVIDNREEFETVYAAYGIDGTYAEEFDYTENILILSINYPIDQIYALERKVTWQGDVPYILPKFSYQNKMEASMIFYYEVPRTEVLYEKEDKVYTTKLHLSNPEYSEKQREHINFFPVFNKWGWAFDRINYGG